MTKTQIAYSPTTDTAPDLTRGARARVWAFVYDCHARKNAAGMTSTNGDDAKGFEFDRAKESIPKF